MQIVIDYKVSRRFCFVQEYEQRLSESGVAVPASEAIWRPSSSLAPGTSHMEMEVKNKDISNKLVNFNDYVSNGF